jgi:aminoglycoside phosphotransferase family enzyme
MRPARAVGLPSKVAFLRLPASYPEPTYRVEATRDGCKALRHFVEGHGDLRPEHLCLEDGITLIDCLEFSRELRLVDPVDELGFLALECERLGAPAMGAALLQGYCDLSGDRPGRELTGFYQGMRATTRALLAARHLDEPKFRYSEAWRIRAADYLRLAGLHQDSISSSSEPPSCSL